LQFLEYLVLFENKIRYTLGILKAYKALNIPQIDTEVIQRKPVHLHPAADLLPIKFSHAQNLSPVFSHIRRICWYMALSLRDQPRANPVPEPAEV